MSDPSWLQDSVLVLQRQLRAAREDPDLRDLVEWLEQRLQDILNEQDRLIEAFVTSHCSALLRLAARFVGPSNAEDIAQDAFVSLNRWILVRPLEHVMRVLENRGELDRLMRCMTVRRAIEWIRKHRRPNELAAEDPVDAELAGTGWQELPRTAFEMTRLERAYEQLPPMQRVVHILHHYYGHTDTEIAQMLRLTKPCVRTLAARANFALKRAMEENGR